MKFFKIQYKTSVAGALKKIVIKSKTRIDAIRQFSKRNPRYLILNVSR